LEDVNNVPIGVVTCLLVFFALPSSASSDGKQSFDLIGALLMILTLSCFALATSPIESFSSTTKLALLGLGAIGLSELFTGRSPPTAANA
jgi:hypothetical protein